MKLNYEKANEALDFKFDFSSEKIKYNPQAAFLPNTLCRF